MRGRYRRVLCIVLCVLLGVAMVHPVAVSAENKMRTVRVGCAVSLGYHQKDEDGRISGYGYEYEQALAQYAGWNIEYVEGSWTELQEMLKNGEINLLGFLVQTTEREQIYDFADHSSGESMSCLISSADNKVLTYEDYDAFDGMTVAMQNGNGNVTGFESFCKEHGFSVNIKTVDTYDEVYDVISDGSADAGLVTNYQVHGNYNIIAQMMPVNYRYAVTKGNETLLAELNDAIADIDTYRPDYEQELYKKYYADTESLSIMYTKEELDYLQTQPVVKVVASTRRKPLEAETGNAGEYEGIVPSVLNEITALTQIQFQYDTTAHGLDDISDMEGNVITSLVDDYGFAQEKKLRITQPFAEGDLIMLLHDVDTGIQTIALCDQEYINRQVEEYYSNWKVTTYDGPQECVEAVRTGKCDITLLDSYEANYYTSQAKYKNIAQMSMDTQQNLCLGISENSDPLLYSILSKTLLMIPQDTYDSIISYYLSDVPESGFSDMVYSHPVQAMLLFGVMALLLFGMVIMLVYADSSKRKRLEVEAVSRDRTDFFARMSHDMRTPMNGILGMLHLASEEKDMDKVQENIAKAENSGQYMLSLINDTLDLQKLESGKMTLEQETVRCGDFIADLESMVRPTAEQKGIHMVIHAERVGEQDYVKLDPVRVKQIFVNLISNAVKFTPEGGQVEFVAECTGKDGAIAHGRFYVRDTGIGMSPEYLKKHIFKAYSQENNGMTSKYAGSGLGLAIVKNLVDIMGGTIEVKSELGEGTEYVICLDFEMADAEDLKQARSQNKMDVEQYGQCLKGKHILICEDHPLNAEIEKRLLEKVGCEVDWAANGQEGASMFQSSEEMSYDAVLMDIRMPVMDGLEATKAIRSMERADAKTVPIIAVTANAYDSDVKQSGAAGMNAHLSKPIDPNRMYKVMAECMNEI